VLLNLFKRRRELPITRRIATSEEPVGSLEHSMISPWEYSALRSFASGIWDAGASRRGAIIDGGSFIGTSTRALAAGLRRSPLTDAERYKKIWSYDLFRATPLMARHYFAGQNVETGGSFRHIYDANIRDDADYIQTHEGDIRSAPIPDGPVSICFLDVLWNWDATQKVADRLFPLLTPGHSILIHQDFVYPFYPWVILSMGLLTRTFAFAYNVPHSSVVFDVQRRYKTGRLDDLRNISEAKAIAIYDRYIERLEGWGKGALGLGKALFLASRYKLDDATRLVDEIERRFVGQDLVVQYLPSIRGYVANARNDGFATPLDAVSGQ